jgi:hypothetical protein
LDRLAHRYLLLRMQTLTTAHFGLSRGLSVPAMCSLSMINDRVHWYMLVKSVVGTVVIDNIPVGKNTDYL